MLNLIRSNLFRMVHTKSVIVVFALLMLMSFISGSLAADESWQMIEQIEESNRAAGGEIYNETKEEHGDFGIYSDIPLNSDGTLKDYVYIYSSDLSSGIVVLFILIGAVLFFRSDEKNGFIKNIAGQTKHKYNILLSKLAVTGFYTFVCMFCYMVIGYIAFATGVILDGSISFGIEYLPEAIKVFALQYLLYMAFISGLLLVTEFTKSTSAGITIGLLETMGFGKLFVTITQKVFNTDFDISKYYISTNILKVNMDAQADVLKFALGIGIVYFILYNVLNVLWFSKKDIV